MPLRAWSAVWVRMILRRRSTSIATRTGAPTAGGADPSASAWISSPDSRSTKVSTITSSPASVVRMPVSPGWPPPRAYATVRSSTTPADVTATTRASHDIEVGVGAVEPARSCGTSGAPARRTDRCDPARRRPRRPHAAAVRRRRRMTGSAYPSRRRPLRRSVHPCGAIGSGTRASNERSSIRWPCTSRIFEPANPPSSASRTFAASTPERSASRSASATASIVAATTSWLHALATCPAPLGPTCTMFFPSASNTGSGAGERVVGRRRP